MGVMMGAPPSPLQIDYIDPDGFDWNLSDMTFSKGYICTGISGIEGLIGSLQSVPLLDGWAWLVYSSLPRSITGNGWTSAQ
jgi:hypothetical protein